MKEVEENLSDADKKLCRMLGALEKMEAPKDFDFHLKARIANANPKAYQPGLVRRYAYVMSVSTLALALIAAGFYGNFYGTAETTTAENETPPAQQQTVQPQTVTIPQVAAAEPPTTNPEATASTNTAVITTQRTPTVPPTMAFDQKTDERKTVYREAKENNVKPKSDGSIDRAVEGADAITPRGINPKGNSSNSGDLNKTEDFQPRDILKTLGAETVVENGVLKVKNVQPNSPAANSGLKADDVIDTLNGQKVTGRPIRGTKIEVKKVGVKRGAQTVEVDLQAKPQQ